MEAREDIPLSVRACLCVCKCVTGLESVSALYIVQAYLTHSESVLISSLLLSLALSFSLSLLTSLPSSPLLSLLAHSTSLAFLPLFRCSLCNRNHFCIKPLVVLV